MHKTQRGERTVEEFPIECVYDRIARLLGVHARKTDSSTGALRVAQYPRGNDFSIRREHRFQIDFANVRWQVGDVEIGRVLLLLLKQTEYAARYIILLQRPFYARLRAIIDIKNAALLFDIRVRPLISQTAPHQKYIIGMILCCTGKIHSVLNVASIFDRSRFGALWFQNEQRIGNLNMKHWEHRWFA